MSKYNINKRQVKILELLKVTGNATAAELCKIIGVTKETALSDLRRLIYVGLVVNISLNTRCVVAQPV